MFHSYSEQYTYQMNQQRKKQVLQPSWKTITQSKAVNQYLPGFFGRAGFSLSSRNHIVFDANVPHSHHVQVVSIDRQNECYVCRLKNPLVRHVAAAASAKTDWKELKRTALREDTKPWFGSNAKSLLFSILQLLIFFSGGIEHISYQLSRPLFHLALRSRDMNNGSQEDQLIVYVSWLILPHTREKSWGSRLMRQ